MRIALFVGESMVPAVDGYPEAGRELQATCSKDYQTLLEPSRTDEAAMSEKAMKS